MTSPGSNSTIEPGGATVRIHTLGRFQVLVDGVPIRSGIRAHRKTLELLKVLVALGGENVPETLLSESLWPEADGDLAHGAFSSTLHRLRKLIGSDALILRDRRLTLDPAICWVDTRAFTALLEQASQALPAGDGEASGRHLDEALAVYKGPFLEGEFEPPEILSAREKLHGLFLRHVEEMGGILRENGQYAAAVTLYQKGIEADDLAEGFYRELMRCYQALGRTGEGIAAYRRCRNLLQASVGIDPSPETEEAYRALLADQRGKKPDSELADDTGTVSPASPVSQRQGAFGRRPTLALAMAGVLLALGAGLWAGWIYMQAPAVDGGNEAMGEKPGLPLSGKPSIAVLAFDNMSGDPDQEYFSDGFTDNIITELSRNKALDVIARHSSFAFKGRGDDIRLVGRKLGAHYVVEGSVQRSAERVRITVQLIDSETGKHLWAERYDREISDLFVLQDEITGAIATAIPVIIRKTEIKDARRKNPANLQAWDYVWRAREAWNQFNFTNPEVLRKARPLYVKALEIEPEFVWAIRELGWTDFHLARWDGPESFRNSVRLAKKAEQLDPEDARTHWLLGIIYWYLRQPEKSLSAYRQAHQLEPNQPSIAINYGWILALWGREAEGVPIAERALKLNPFPPEWYWRHMVTIYYFSGRFREAIKSAERIKDLSNRTLRNLAASHIQLGNQAKAREYAELLMQQEPNFSLAAFAQGANGLVKMELLESYLEVLRQAGLK